MNIQIADIGHVIQLAIAVCGIAAWPHRRRSRSTARVGSTQTG